MGLDMYVHSCHKDAIEDNRDVDFEIFYNNHVSSFQSQSELFYWRKHYKLHDWMETLYRQKGGTAESFNCVNVQLTDDDLDKLLSDFAGQTSEVSNFISLARNELSQGKKIYYTSWW